MSKGTPASSQIIWFEGEVERLRTENKKLLAENNEAYVFGLHKGKEAALIDYGIDALRAENAKLRASNRWNIEQDGDDLVICENDHDKGEKCDYRRWYSQSHVDRLRAENEKLRDDVKGLRLVIKDAITFIREQADTIAAHVLAAALKETE